MKRTLSYLSIIMPALMLMSVIFFLPEGTNAAEDNVNIGVYVEGCNNNGTCQAVIGEDVLTCPADCTTTPPSTSTSSAATNPPSNRTSGYRVRQAGSARILITDLKIFPTHDSAFVTWNTSEPSVSTLAWGVSTDYERGAIGEYHVSTTHAARIPGLIPDARYYLSIVVTDKSGRYGSIQSPFSTYPAYAAPVTGITVTEGDQWNEFKLDWTNPEGAEYIRVVRIDGTDPADPYSGEVVYEGVAEGYRGQKREEGQRYSVFSRKDGVYTLIGTADVATSTGQVINGPSDVSALEEKEQWPLLGSIFPGHQWLWGWLLLPVIIIYFIFKRAIL